MGRGGRGPHGRGCKCPAFYKPLPDCPRGETAAAARRGAEVLSSTDRTGAALYLRVSTEEQVLENQRPELERIARARDLEVLEVYEEHGSAARRRPVFERMFEDARRGRFRVLLFWALDRFGRSHVDNVRDALELDRLGVELVSAREAWLDTGGPVRNLLISIFSWIAEQERERLRERTCAGLARAKAQGTKLGRPRRVTPKELEAAARMAQDDRSVREIAVALKIPRATLHRALASQKRVPGVQLGRTRKQGG